MKQRRSLTCSARPRHPVRMMILLVMLLVPVLGPGPAPAQQAKIDSLQKVIDRSKADRNRVNALVAMAEIILTRDRVKAMSHAVEAEKLAAKLRYNKGIARACLSLAGVRLAGGDYPGAELDLDRARTICEMIRDRSGIASALRYYGLL